MSTQNLRGAATAASFVTVKTWSDRDVWTGGTAVVHPDSGASVTHRETAVRPRTAAGDLGCARLSEGSPSEGAAHCVLPATWRPGEGTTVDSERAAAVGALGAGRRDGRSTGDCRPAKPLCGAATVGTRHDPSVQTHRPCATRTEPDMLRGVGDADPSARIHQSNRC